MMLVVAHPKTGHVAESAPKMLGTRLFFHHIRNIAADIQARRILNFGAGHGLVRPHDSRDLRDIAEVWACDIDPAVLCNPTADHALVISEGEVIDLPAGSFDLIVCDWVFEHIEDPGHVARELVRLLGPGGVICARTPRRWGYVALAARLVPNGLHETALRWIQPGRGNAAYPTRYRLNTVAQVRHHFADCAVSHYRDGVAPAYYFNSRMLRKALSWLHDMFPEVMSTAICFFIEKPPR